MSFPLCPRCLSKILLYNVSPLGLFLSRNVAPIAAFSTTAAFKINPPKKKASVVKTQNPDRGNKQTFRKTRKKAESVERSRRPAIGERKALRKRVVLSNTNALEVNGLEDVSTEKLMDERLRGQVLGIPGEVVDQLRAAEAFKAAQGWGLYRRPAMLIRRDTGDYARMMENLGKRIVRRVLVGERGSGKTVMLLQAMAMAFLRGWVVINLPEGMFFVDALVSNGIKDMRS